MNYELKALSLHKFRSNEASYNTFLHLYAGLGSQQRYAQRNRGSR